MHKARFRIALPAALLGALALGACGANEADASKRSKDREQQGSGGPGSTNSDGDTFPGGGDGDGLGRDGLDGDSACAAEKRTGELVPLDMYVMLDKSGSMQGAFWASVTQALKAFVDSPESHGMGMGIQYYPLPPKVPVPPPPESCATDADCAPYHGDCIPFLGCEGALLGGMVDESCNPADYEIPDVAIGLLPIWADKIKASLDKTKPSGGTPTYPALKGAHDYAKTWAQAHPGHVTAVILATDGDPNGCGSSTTNNTTGIAGLAEQALKANSVLTFVIGVGEDFKFKSDLDTIAAAGGTDKAIFVDGGESQEFLDALTTIRGSVACEYRIPTPQKGEPDYNRVNVNITVEGKTEDIGRVASQAECDPDKGGWYYDDPKAPNRILLCHQSCQLVKSGSQMAPVEVDVLLGCQTKIW